jgi:hypothetical protein
VSESESESVSESELFVRIRIRIQPKNSDYFGFGFGSTTLQITQYNTLPYRYVLVINANQKETLFVKNVAIRHQAKRRPYLIITVPYRYYVS